MNDVISEIFPVQLCKSGKPAGPALGQVSQKCRSSRYHSSHTAVVYNTAVQQSSSLIGPV